jgi:toxin ParE1/3/4
VPRYVLSPEARDDLRDIRDYLAAEGGKRLARYVLGELSAAFQSLASHPEAGHLRQDLTPLPVKFWPVFSYLIVYDPATRPLGVVRVLHGRRDVRAILARDQTGDPAS